MINTGQQIYIGILLSDYVFTVHFLDGQNRFDTKLIQHQHKYFSLDIKCTTTFFSFLCNFFKFVWVKQTSKLKHVIGRKFSSLSSVFIKCFRFVLRITFVLVPKKNLSCVLWNMYKLRFSVVFNSIVFVKLITILSKLHRYSFIWVIFNTNPKKRVKIKLHKLNYSWYNFCYHSMYKIGLR